MKVQKLDKETWKLLSEGVHRIVFRENRPPETERVDFALIVEDAEGVPASYSTCREFDAETLYWQYGGSFPGTKGTINSLKNFQAMVRWAKEAGYKRLTFLVENTNFAMLKLALITEFKITGVRVYQQHVLLEHLLEFA